MMKFYLIDRSNNLAILENQFGIVLLPNCVRVGNEEYSQYNVYNTDVLFCEEVVNFRAGKYQRIGNELQLNQNYSEPILNDEEILVLRDEFIKKIEAAIIACWDKHSRFYEIDHHSLNYLREYINSNYQASVPQFVVRHASIFNKTNEESAQILFTELSMQDSVLNNLASLKQTGREILLKNNLHDMQVVLNNVLMQIGFIENNNAP